MFEFTTLFCTIDDFFQKNEAVYWQYLKEENPKVRQRSGVLCLSEIVFIAVWYKNSQLYHFKAFYGMIKRFYSKLFKALPSYQRMIYLINQHQLALQALHISLTSEIIKDKLAKQDIELITYHRKNMRPVELSSEDEFMLRQRNKIETIFGLLKQQYSLVSSRHRSISGYFAGIYASLCAYQICHQNKPQFTTM